jgi:hypothetical protein
LNDSYAHATPLLPKKGAKRLRKDAATRGEHQISASAWLRKKTGRKKTK